MALTAFVFPAPGYFSPDGISLGRTLVLVARNAALVGALVLLARDAMNRIGRRRALSADDNVIGEP